MHVDEQQILSISRELWANQLGLSIDPAGDPATEPLRDDKILSSRINISGPFQGAILLECPESVARHAAAMLFASDGEEATVEDIHDALKELSIMIGKRMRPLLPESTKLSRPAVVAVPAEVHDEGMQGVSDLKLRCEGRLVRIALLQRESEAVAAG
jgi:hypothetical protein